MSDIYCQTAPPRWTEAPYRFVHESSLNSSSAYGYETTRRVSESARHQSRSLGHHYRSTSASYTSLADMWTADTSALSVAPLPALSRDDWTPRYSPAHHQPKQMCLAPPAKIYTSFNPYPRKASGAQVPPRHNAPRPRPTPLSTTQEQGRNADHSRNPSTSSSSSSLSTSAGHFGSWDSSTSLESGSFTVLDSPVTPKGLASSASSASVFALPTLSSPTSSLSTPSRSSIALPSSEAIVGQASATPPASSSRHNSINTSSYVNGTPEVRATFAITPVTGRTASNSGRRPKGYVKSAQDAARERDRYLERNREAALRSRARKKAAQEHLEVEAVQLGAANKVLQSDAWALRNEVLQLREIIEALDGPCCGHGQRQAQAVARRGDAHFWAAEAALGREYTEDVEELMQDF